MAKRSAATKPRCRITAKQHRATLKYIAEFRAQEKAAADDRRETERAAIAIEIGSMIVAAKRQAEELLERFGFGDWRPLLSLQEKPRKMSDVQWEQLHTAQQVMYAIDWVNRSLAGEISYNANLAIEQLRTLALRMEWLPLVATGRATRNGAATAREANTRKTQTRQQQIQAVVLKHRRPNAKHWINQARELAAAELKISKKTVERATENLSE